MRLYTAAVAAYRTPGREGGLLPGGTPRLWLIRARRQGGRWVGNTPLAAHAGAGGRASDR